MTLLGSQPADFIRASSHAVLREQAEHMDAPDWYSSLNKSSCAAGVVHTWTYNGPSLHSYAGAGVVHAITSILPKFFFGQALSKLVQRCSLIYPIMENCVILRE